MGVTTSDSTIADLPSFRAGKMPTYRIREKNTFIDTHYAASETSSIYSRYPRSCPGRVAVVQEGGVASLVMKSGCEPDDARLGSACASNVDAATECNELACVNEDTELGTCDSPVAQQCQHCQSEDPSGYDDQSGSFYCARCWEEWYQRNQAPSEAPEESLAVRFENLDPISDLSVVRHETEIKVVD